MRHIIPISGKDSLATALVQTSLRPDLPYEFMFNPTGAELPDVFEWIRNVGKHFGKPVTFVGENLEAIIEEYNYFLPSSRARYCTRQAKIEPMEKWMGQDECIVYYGIRADEKRTGYTNASGRITPNYPLVEAGIGITGVYEIINAAGLKPPCFFWKSVYDMVCRIVGGEGVVKALLTEWQIDILFAGRSRANCFFCYNQRLYEWVWWSETHPALFAKAEGMEHLGGDKIYTWNRAKSLQTMKDESVKIKKSRVRAIVKIIQKMKQGVLSFPDDEINFLDTLSLTSCGLFCGK